MEEQRLIDAASPEAYINRELSWLSFARRVLELTADHSLPLLERMKLSGIMGMILDEFVMKRMGGLHHISSDGLTPSAELAVCWREPSSHIQIISDLIEDDLRPALA
jgi:polyphosphate kinase